MPSSVDLHTHTTASDGTLEPLRLAEKAVALGVKVLAISDHDSTAGYDAVAAARANFPGLSLIPAIEMGAEGRWACHLLGYGIDTSSTRFQDRLAVYRRLRIERVRAMVARLHELGCPVAFDRVLALARGGAVGRPHIADALVEGKIVRNRQEAFDRFLKREGPAYVPGTIPEAEEIIRLLRSVGGVPVLAHPSYHTSPELLKALLDMGLMGIEAYYPDYSRSLTRHYLEFARDHHLIATGGSDFHGPKTGRNALACVLVPESVPGEIEAAKSKL